VARKDGAGILAIALATGRALVLLRSRYVTDPLTWSVPGGGEEPSDRGRLRSTAVREFIEETGHEPGRMLPVIAALVRPDGSRFEMYAAFLDREFRPRVTTPPAKAGGFLGHA